MGGGQRRGSATHSDRRSAGRCAYCPQKQQRPAHWHHRRASRRDYRVGRVLYDDTKGTTIEKVKIDHDDDDVSVKGDPNKFDDDDDDADDDDAIGEQNIYDQLSSYYNRLSDLDQQVRDCATTFNTYYLKDDRSSRQSASDAAEALEDQIGDLKDEVEDLDVPIDSQNYSSWKDIITLYDDLENRIDVICDAWEISLEYSSPANHKDEIVAPLARDNVAGTNDNKYRLDFEDRYPGAAPVEVK